METRKMLRDKESKYSIEILQGIYYILFCVHVGLSVDISMSGYLVHDHRWILAYLSLAQVLGIWSQDFFPLSHLPNPEFYFWICSQLSAAAGWTTALPTAWHLLIYLTALFCLWLWFLDDTLALLRFTKALCFIFRYTMCDFLPRRNEK